ncbi:MAG: SycD/LcrH family type III secretion system chaperone [Planctomycetota bacterium]
MNAKTKEILPREQVREALQAGSTLGPICGLDQDQVEVLYSYGYRYYEQNKYEEAEMFFGSACMLNHRESRYWLALGATRQAAGSFAEAIQAYSRIVDCDEIPPIFAIRIAECFLSNGDLEESVSTIYHAVDLADATQDFEVIEEVVSKGELLLSILENRLGDDSEEQDEQQEAHEPAQVDESETESLA